MDDARSETLSLLLEVGHLLSSKLEVEELLTTVIELSSRVVGAESASLLLLDEKTQELYFDVALGLGPEAAKVRLPLGQGIAGTVAQERKPAIIDDARQDPRWSSKMDEQSGFVTRSILAAPMLIKGKLIGVLEAINKRDGKFSAADLRTFEAFASQASVAIENARLFASLREQSFRLQTVFSQMTDSSLLIDASGRVLLANEAARNTFSAAGDLSSLAAALGGMAVTPPLARLLDSRAALHELEAVREAPKKLILAGTATRIELGAGRGDGQPSGEAGWLCVFRDVTEARTKERLKRSFLSLISHKLKTPLSSIIGFSEILLLDFPEGSADEHGIRKAATTISGQGKKLAELVDKLLKYVTLEDPEASPRLELCAIDEVIDEVLAEMKEWLAQKKASVSVEKRGITALADKLQLRDVFKNLIENAVKFDPKPEKKVAIRSEEAGGLALVSVSDNGPGIPPEDQEKIYSQFHQIESSFTGQIEGWGLGLPFVKKVVERHGGTVLLKSKLGEGTTVSVSLPRPGRSQSDGAA